MKAELNWTEGMHFEATNTVISTNVVPMDANPPYGKNHGMTPKELVVAGLGGCTAMDVIGLMKKHKQDVKAFQILVDADHSSGPAPQVFTQIRIEFRLTGQIDKNIALEAVQLSQTKYCGVSAMLSLACPIEYKVWVNEEEVGSGKADFGK